MKKNHHALVLQLIILYWEKKTSKSNCLYATKTPEIILSEREKFIYDVHFVICENLMTELN